MEEHRTIPITTFTRRTAQRAAHRREAKRHAQSIGVLVSKLEARPMVGLDMPTVPAWPVPASPRGRRTPRRVELRRDPEDGMTWQHGHQPVGHAVDVRGERVDRQPLDLRRFPAATGVIGNSPLMRLEA